MNAPSSARARVLGVLLRWGILLGALGLSTLLILLLRPVAIVLPYFFFAIIAALVLPLAEGAVALALCVGLTVYLLGHRPAPLPPLPSGTILQVAAWILGTGVGVLVLTERMRRQVRAAVRRAENVLPAAREHGPDHLYARLLSEAPDAVVVVDSAGFIVFYNRQAESLFGYTRDEILGLPVERLLPEEVRARHVQYRAAFMADPHTRPMGLGRTLLAQRKDGAAVPVDVALAPVQSSQGGKNALIVKAAVRDIRARLEIEAQLASERAGKEAALAAVTERDAFLSIAAHELRTPLTSLRGYTELLAEAVQRAERMDVSSQEYGQLRARAAHSIAALERQSARMVALVDRLLDVARLGTGKMRLERTQVDLAALARTAVGGLVHAPQVVAWGDTVVSGDALRLEQVLANLVDNAEKYAPGTVWLDVDGSAAGHVTVILCDRGPGIPAEERAHVFSRFYQVGRRERTTGLGLGLFLAHEIVQLHGGTITLCDNGEQNSNEGGGLCVHVQLPRTAVSTDAVPDAERDLVY